MSVDPERQKERRAFLVTGTVQGVGFRIWTKTVASRLGLAGVVRNLPDGTVRVEATGSPSALSTLRTALETGPPAAIVSSVEELPPSGDRLPSDFRVIH